MGYVAPEQYVGTKNVGGRADVFGLEMTMYYVAAGINPGKLLYVTPTIRNNNSEIFRRIYAIIEKYMEPDG